MLRPTSPPYLIRPITLPNIQRVALRTHTRIVERLNEMAGVTTNSIGRLYELLTAAKLDFDTICSHQNAERHEDGAWHYSLVLRLNGVDFASDGKAESKQAAKHLAYKSLLDQVSPLLLSLRDQVRSNMAPVELTPITKDLAYQLISEHLSIAMQISSRLRKSVVVHSLDQIVAPYKTIDIDDRIYSYQEYEQEIFALSRTAQHFRGSKARAISDLYYMQPLTSRSLDGSKIYVHNDIVANMGPNETPVEPVAQVGVMDNPGTTTIPHLPNPQPTAVTPAMAAQDPSLVSALEPLLPHETLNPMGPPNMLAVGGVTFDIKDLIYSQYLDCDVQYQYTDDTPQGQVIFQIPYDPTSDFVNPYIKQWLALHPRYTGALNFRFTVIGNSTFSGLIGFSWYPRPINSNVVKISEMMKYSYTSMGVNEPSNRIFTLFDARQTKFWRDTGDSPTGDVRPVLVAYVYMTAVSPLKEGITIRIRVASKLSDGSDGPPFVAAEPTLPAVTPGVGQPSPTGIDSTYVQLLNGMPVYPVVARPLEYGKPLYLTVDGVVFKPKMEVDVPVDLVSLPQNPWCAVTGLRGPTAMSLAFSTTGNTANSPIAGIYFLDLSRVSTLLTASSNGENPIVSQFQSTYSSTSGNLPPLDGLADKISSQTKLYQIVNYLSPTIDPNNQPSFTTGPLYSAISIQHLAIKKIDLVCYYTQAGPIYLAQLTPVSGTATVTGTDFCSMIAPGWDPKYELTQLAASYPEAGWTPETMPKGWVNACITADPPYVTPPGFNTFQSYNHASVQSFFDMLAIRTSPTQVVEVTLADMDSGTDLAYVRYLPDRQCAIMNFGPDSTMINATLIRPLLRAYISKLAVVERSNTFPVTDKRNFVENTTDVVLHRRRQLKMGSAVYNPSNDGYVRANAAAIGAAFAGQAISGVGQGISAAGGIIQNREQMKWMEHMMRAKYGIDADLMDQSFGWQSKLQGNMFDFNKLMQGNMFDFQNQFQSNQNSFLSAISRQNADQQLFNAKETMRFQQELAGYRTPGAVYGMNRAGLGPQGSTGSLPAYSSMPGENTRTRSTSSSSLASLPGNTDSATQTANSSSSVGTQAGRIPLPQSNPRGSLPSSAGAPKKAQRSRYRAPAMSASVALNSAEPPRFRERSRRVGVSNPSGVGGVGAQTGSISMDHPRMETAAKGYSTLGSTFA